MARRQHGTRRFPRTARVNEVVREVLAETVERMSDPRLELVTLTGVEVSPDLREAAVYYSSLGPSDDAAAALQSAAPHLRTVLGREVRLKYLPRLSFTEDPGIVQGRRVEEILRELHRNERLDGGPSGGDR
ncbi:MAG: 30S ribosome-binding factor RbfA [Actinobacteria bacterium]|nr:30S ribosome-binding factor RbfA [Actinomycetota bacterium]